ncbi:MAG: NUDIX hydrolase [Deltaproteobacteria bacterium]|nr:NUDIX hydrolase [Deltaproteobacteria bacterium]
MKIIRWILGLLILSLGMSSIGAAKGLYLGDAKKGEIQILKEELVFSNKWVRFYNDKVKFPNGKEGTYIRLVPSQVSPQGFSGAGVLAITEKGQVILERIFRHAPRKWLLEAPHGSWEPNESLLQTAKRELGEETGFTCPRWQDLGSILPASSAISYKQKLFLAQHCTKAGEATDPEESKRIRLKLFSWAEVMKRVEKDEIQDGLTLALILKGQKFLKGN